MNSLIQFNFNSRKLNSKRFELSLIEWLLNGLNSINLPEIKPASFHSILILAQLILTSVAAGWNEFHAPKHPSFHSSLKSRINGQNGMVLFTFDFAVTATSTILFFHYWSIVTSHYCYNISETEPQIYFWLINSIPLQLIKLFDWMSSIN